MQINNTSEVYSFSNQNPHSAITIKNDYLIKLQRLHLLLTNLIPACGFLTAILLSYRFGVGFLEINLLIFMSVLTTIGITVGFHRYFSHEAFQTSKTIRIFLAIIGSMAAQSPLIYWVAQHRRHHKYSDSFGDTHSPNLSNSKIRGLWHAHLGWVLVPEATNTSLFAKNLIQNSQIYQISKLYYVWVLLGLLIPALIEVIMTQTWQGFCYGFLWGGLVRIFLVQHFTFSINSICHSFGNSNFKTNDKSKNNLWLAIFTCGESWHNNHHAFPTSAKFGLKWWQIDLGYGLIRLLQLLSLAWNVKIPTPEKIAGRK